MNVFVKPGKAPDGTVRLVRRPDRNWSPLPKEGGWVVLDEYWTRRIRDEDVVEAEPPADDEPTPEPATKEPAAAKRRGR